jgi:hypothetical protein
MAALLLVLITAMLGDWIPLALAAYLFAALVIANAAVCIWYTGRIHDIFDSVAPLPSHARRRRTVATQRWSH